MDEKDKTQNSLNNEDLLLTQEQKERLAEMFDDDSFLKKEVPKSENSNLSEQTAKTVVSAPQNIEDEPKIEIFTRSYKKTVLIILGLIILVVLTGLFTYKIIKNPKFLNSIGQKSSQASPLGFLANTKGKEGGRLIVKIDDQATEVNYYLVDNQLYLEMIPNADIINEKLLYLFNKDIENPENKIKSNDEKANLIKVSKYVNFNFTNMYGLESLNNYSPDDLFSLYLPFATGDISIKELGGAVNEESSFSYRISKFIKRPKCQPAAQDVKNYVSDDRLNIGLFAPKDKTNQVDAKNTFQLDNSKLSELSQKLDVYIDECLVDGSNVGQSDKKNLQDIAKKRYGSLPKVTITVDKQKINIQTERQLENNQPPIKQNVEFEILQAVPATSAYSPQTAKNKYLNSRVVSYALAYEECRNSPVVISESLESYHYMLEDKEYSYPSALDSGYVCLTTDKATASASSTEKRSLDLTFSLQLTKESEEEKMFQKYHNIRYYFEQSYKKNNRYPTEQELAGGAVDGVTKELYSQNVKTKDVTMRLAYKGLPDKCASDCKDYELSLEMYFIRTNNPVTINSHTFFKKRSE
ncbi:hypothetical protein A3F37_00710 [Candidatus Saccharibacteria bacterium RIFCSPHIGHO2_12_FULL_41_12]|nr:MAG: hypothetical protein A3F37_00710 [Candidatus Saccharibacteria bacterium RIFCSPHIGHO2_12_FULL_41_12]